MKSVEAIAGEIDQLVQSHYYSEDFELVSAIRAYGDRLDEADRATLAQVVMKRLLSDGSIVDILLCSIVPVPSAVPILAARLNAEKASNQITRALITALKAYRTDEAYTAVERFIDSDQEMETLQALAEIDFVRTLPVMARLMRKDYYQGIVLHILYDRMKTAGIEQLISDINQSSVSRSHSFQETLQKSLQSKKEPYNPFSSAEIEHIIVSVGLA